MKVKVRSDGSVRITGYVNVVERESKLLSKCQAHDVSMDFTETISAGAFRESLRNHPNVELRFNHQRKLTDAQSGGLSLTEDSVGLYADCIIADSEVRQAAQAGKLTGWSFGFTNDVAEVTQSSDTTQHRRVRSLLLREVSILTLPPAYVATSITGVEQRMENEPEIMLRSEESPQVGGEVNVADELRKLRIKILSVE